MAIQQRTDSGMFELALFAGAGGGILGGKLIGIELNPEYCALAKRRCELEIFSHHEKATT